MGIEEQVLNIERKRCIRLGEQRGIKRGEQRGEQRGIKLGEAERIRLKAEQAELLAQIEELKQIIAGRNN
jgi:hypothetical protein